MSLIWLPLWYKRIRRTIYFAFCRWISKGRQQLKHGRCANSKHPKGGWYCRWISKARQKLKHWRCANSKHPKGDMGCGLPNYLCGGRMWAPKLSLGWLKICLGFIIPTMMFLSQPLAFMWQSLAFLLPSISQTKRRFAIWWNKKILFHVRWPVRCLILMIN